MKESGRDEDVAGCSRERFRTTRWTLILAAREEDREAAREALAALCESYWYPLYAFVRRKGHDPDSAADLVQGFFARLLEKKDLGSVDQRLGKFRSFLMASCSHFLANQADHDRARKRGGGKVIFSIDRLQAEGRYGVAPIDRLTPERLFERQWALTLLDRVLARLEEEMTLAGKSLVYRALRPALLGSGDRMPYATIAGSLGISEEAARASALRLRRRYRDSALSATLCILTAAPRATAPSQY